MSQADPIDADAVDTSIDKLSDGKWTVKYTVEKAVTKITFLSNPDKSRIERWHPLSSEFEVFYHKNQEYIARKDRAKFNEISLLLTPNYKHLPKDYAPFSPYSDGGILFHTRRFFACIDSCPDDLNSWKITLTIPNDNHIILDGKLFNSMASWYDKNDGKSVYVGKQIPVETDSSLTLIDAGLPEKILTSLNSDIPKMMDFFKSKLGKLPYDDKPTLFASYAKVNGSSRQGGVSPNQIYVHWNKNNLDTSVENKKFIYDTLWFFAHEAAHLYQINGHLSENANESWLHEGHADFLASNALKFLYPNSTDYINSKFNKIKTGCANGLQDIALVDAANFGNFRLLYSCGFLIHKGIEHAFKKENKNGQAAYIIWDQFRTEVKNGSEKGQPTFLKVVDKYTDKTISGKITHFINVKHGNPDKAINALLAL